MRITAAYYLFLLYATVMFRPAIPVIKDAVSHTFSEAIHIATVHAIYGSNHLQKEIAESDVDNSNSKHHNGSGVNAEEQIQVHISSYEFVFINRLGENDTTYLSLINHKLRNGFIIKFSPPPKFC